MRASEKHIALCVLVLAMKAISLSAQTTPVYTDPTGSQTITQPATTSLNFAGAGTYNFSSLMTADAIQPKSLNGFYYASQNGGFAALFSSAACSSGCTVVEDPLDLGDVSGPGTMPSNSHLINTLYGTQSDFFQNVNTARFSSYVTGFLPGDPGGNTDVGTADGAYYHTSVVNGWLAGANRDNPYYKSNYTDGFDYEGIASYSAGFHDFRTGNIQESGVGDININTWYDYINPGFFAPSDEGVVFERLQLNLDGTQLYYSALTGDTGTTLSMTGYAGKTWNLSNLTDMVDLTSGFTLNVTGMANYGFGIASWTSDIAVTPSIVEGILSQVNIEGIVFSGTTTGFAPTATTISFFNGSPSAPGGAVTGSGTNSLSVNLINADGSTRTLSQIAGLFSSGSINTPSAGVIWAYTTDTTTSGSPIGATAFLNQLPVMRQANGSPTSITFAVSTPTALAPGQLANMFGTTALDVPETYNEVTAISSVGSYSGGVQFITAPLYFPHYAGIICANSNATPAATDVIGEAITLDQFNPSTNKPYTQHVLCATDAHTLLVGTNERGQYKTYGNIIGPAHIYKIAVIHQTIDEATNKENSSNGLAANGPTGTFAVVEPHQPFAVTNTSGITAFSITSGTVTFTAGNTYAPGQLVVVSGLTVGTYLNGPLLTVTSATGTQFQAQFGHADVALTSDTGTAAQKAELFDAAYISQNWQLGSDIINIDNPFAYYNGFAYTLTGAGINGGNHLLLQNLNPDSLYTAFGGKARPPGLIAANQGQFSGIAMEEAPTAAVPGVGFCDGPALLCVGRYASGSSLNYFYFLQSPDLNIILHHDTHVTEFVSPVLGVGEAPIMAGIATLGAGSTVGGYPICTSAGGTGCSGGTGGATLPYPGLVYATSATGGTVATSSQVSTALGVAGLESILNSPPYSLTTDNCYENGILYATTSGTFTCSPSIWHYGSDADQTAGLSFIGGAEGQTTVMGSAINMINGDGPTVDIINGPLDDGEIRLYNEEGPFGVTVSLVGDSGNGYFAGGITADGGIADTALGASASPICTTTGGLLTQSGCSGGTGGATLPYPGLVYATSATGGTVATSSQVSSALGSAGLESIFSTTPFSINTATCANGLLYQSGNGLFTCSNELVVQGGGSSLLFNTGYDSTYISPNEIILGNSGIGGDSIEIYGDDSGSGTIHLWSPPTLSGPEDTIDLFGATGTINLSDGSGSDTINLIGNSGNGFFAGGVTVGSFAAQTATIATSVSSAVYMGPTSAPSGSCSTNGAWVFSQDGHATFCASGTWVTKI